MQSPPRRFTAGLGNGVTKAIVYTTTAGATTIAQFVTNFISGTIAQVGP